MALAHQNMSHSKGGSPYRLREERRHGRILLAEVVPIRPANRSQGAGVGSMMSTIARVFASLRVQAAPVDCPPPTPASPDLRPSGAAPDDAA
jgi:hypothetical protein